MENRLLFEELLRLDYNQKYIARAVDTSLSTISREIKNWRVPNKSDIHCPETERYPFICYNCSKKSAYGKKTFIII